MKQKLWFLVIFLVYSSIQLADAGDKFFFNHTSLLQVSSATLPLNSRFDFRFRTCEGGVLLSQVGNLNNDFIEISVSKGIVNYTISVKPLYFTPSQLTVRWKVGGVENFVHVGNELDKSQYFTVRYVPGVGDANSTISLDGPITSYSASMPRDIRSFVSGGPLYAGGGSGGVWFSGCMESGTNVPFTLESKPTEPTPGCPLDSIAGCPNRKACDAGFTGDYCEINIDECASAPCHSYSTCLDGVNNYTCLCGPRWTGRDCSTNLGNLCDPNPCQNGGVCKETFDRNNYTCACPQGYTGWNCNGTLHPCETLNCTNGGTCQKQSNASDDYVCVCVTGFNCSEDINECESNPCRNNGTCRNEEGKFTCTCLSGFNGTFCEVNIDDCPAHGCNNGTCIDDINNYTCQCFIGFKGRHCEKDIDECRLGYCKNGATCTNTPGNYSCQCTEFTNGTNCQLDINECASSPCLNGALCQNNDCDKTACSDKGYECFCKSGFLGPLCEIDVDECFLAAVDPNKRCENGATCVDKVNRKECICPPGWTGDRCHVDIDECALGFCDNGATCNNFNGTYNCTCIPGYTDRNCSTDINECASNPCENGATCNDLINYFNCTCVPGYTGPLCETDVDECFLAAVDPNKRCENGATCVDKVNGKECICPLGWTGDRCHVYIGKCALGFCDNGATCNNFNGTYNCTCVPGYTDRNCSTDINECASNPCENGATCNDLINYFNCTCVPGYTGFNCSEDINECLSTPCQHSATCNDLVNDFSCNCTANYTGRQCEYLKTRCRPINPCLNGGRCIDIGFENFTCDCSAGFGGPLCENSTTPVSHPVSRATSRPHSAPKWRRNANPHRPAEVNDQNSTIVGFAVLVAILFLVIFGLIVYIVVLKRAGLTTRKRRSEAENPGYSAFQNVAMQENVNQDQHTIPEMGDYEVAPSENREPIPDTIPQYESVNNAPARPPNNGNVTQYDVTQVSSVTQYEAMNSHPSLHQHVAANRQYDGVDSTRICGQNPPAMRARNGTGDHGEPGYENTRKRGLPPEVYQSLQATTQHSESAQYAPLNPLTRIGVRPCGRDERGVGLDIRESEYQELNQIEATDPCYQRVGSRVSSV
ncbi:fibropellin-1 isoform X2 [Nematostella vectensis]|uniref:fibropellin-1 isoform X2 n=1 Tax=Nematostella vectensis TaxID=45351 RepID=UPI002076FF4A|nr:fibropellin-1 isoform X2 [Nematostella vectensis]